MRKVLLLAGEESGALYAERIRQALLQADPATEVRGYGDAGFEIGDLAVMGILGVLRKIFFFMRVKRTMRRMIDEWRPDVVCTVDYPGMNLRLAAYAKSRGIRAVHVVCPQVWAWKRGRIPRIEASVDALCCFFPFEPALFRPGFATFVGHPLLDEIRRERECESAAVAADSCDGRLLAVLPGSRMAEIRHHLPTLLEVIAKLVDRVPGLRVVFPAANAKARDAIQNGVTDFCSQWSGNGSKVSVLPPGSARAALAKADCAVAASGTVTLEAALFGCPTVLVYKVDPFFAFLARRFIRGVRHIGLANIIAEKSGAECPMPELLQEDFTVDAVTQRLLPLLTDVAANAEARQALATTVALLESDGGAIERIARLLA